MLIRRKVFPAASLTLDDAVDNMELIGHDFYLFVDKATNAPSVVYRRRGWTYGVITLDHYCEPGRTRMKRRSLRTARTMRPQLPKMVHQPTKGLTWVHR